MTSEPLLDLTEIQGHILPGFASWNARIIGLKILDTDACSKRIDKYLDSITTMQTSYAKKQVRKQNFMKFSSRLADDQVQMGLAFSANGLKRFDVPLDDLSDRAFVHGMYSSSTQLGDAVGSKSDPDNWKFGSKEDNTPDILFIIASDDLLNLEQFMNELLTDFDGAGSIIFIDKGERMAGDKEHFGFKDAISQPAVRGKISLNEYYATRYISESDPRHQLLQNQGNLWYGQGNSFLVIPVSNPIHNFPGQ